MQSTNVNVNTNGIHCKVATQDTVRRFFVKNPDYNALLDQICSIFGFSKDSVVVKYADDEGDLVTVSSDPELQFAIDLSPRVLKLKVELLSSPPYPTDAPFASSFPTERLCNKKWRKSADKETKRNCKRREKCEKFQRKAGEKWEKKSCKNAEKGNKKSLGKLERVQAKCASLRNKQEKLQTKLASLESNPESPAPSILKVRTKLTFVSSKLAWLEQMTRDLPPSAEVLVDSSDVTSTTEFDSESETYDEKKEELRRKFEEFHQRAHSLRLAFRQAQLQHQLQRTNLQAFLSQNPPQDASFQEAVKQLKANLDASKKEVSDKKEELHKIMAAFGELRTEMHKCGMRKCGKQGKWHRRDQSEEAIDGEDEADDGSDCQFRPWSGPHRGHHGHHGHHGPNFGHPGPHFGHHGPHRGHHQGYHQGHQQGPHQGPQFGTPFGRPGFPGYSCPQGPFGGPRDTSC